MPPRVIHLDAPPTDTSRERKYIEALGATFVPRADGDDPARLVVDADVVLAGGEQVTREIIGGMERCRAVVCYGIGFDHIDTRAATEAGIAVINHPGFCVDEVSNHALMLMLALSRQLHRADGMMRRHEGWMGEAVAVMRDSTVIGRTLGIVGLGGIGRQVARKAAVFGLRVLATDPYIDESVATEHGAKLVPMETLLRESDFVTTHTPLNEETYHLFDEPQFRLMKPTAFFVNTSRGRCVSEAALLRALDEGWIRGAGLDVFEEEPVPSDHPLVGRSDTIVTPHVAFYSTRSQDELHDRIGKATADALAGRIPYNVANPEVLGHTRIAGSG